MDAVLKGGGQTKFGDFFLFIHYILMVGENEKWTLPVFKHYLFKVYFPIWDTSPPNQSTNQLPSPVGRKSTIVHVALINLNVYFLSQFVSLKLEITFYSESIISPFKTLCHDCSELSRETRTVKPATRQNHSQKSFDVSAKPFINVLSDTATSTVI